MAANDTIKPATEDAVKNAADDTPGLPKIPPLTLWLGAGAAVLAFVSGAGLPAIILGLLGGGAAGWFAQNQIDKNTPAPGAAPGAAPAAPAATPAIDTAKPVDQQPVVKDVVANTQNFMQGADVTLAKPVDPKEARSGDIVKDSTGATLATAAGVPAGIEGLAQIRNLKVINQNMMAGRPAMQGTFSPIGRTVKFTGDAFNFMSDTVKNIVGRFKPAAAGAPTATASTASTASTTTTSTTSASGATRVASYAPSSRGQSFASAANKATIEVEPVTAASSVSADADAVMAGAAKVEGVVSSTEGVATKFGIWGTIAAGVLDIGAAGLAGKNALDQGKSPGEALGVAWDKKQEGESLIASNLLTLGLAGTASNVLWEQNKKTQAELGDLVAHVGDRSLGDNVDIYKKIAGEHFGAYGEALKQTVPGEVVGITQSAIEAGKSYSDLNNAALAIDTKDCPHFLYAFGTVLADPAMAAELKQSGVGVNSGGHVSLKELNKALADPATSDQVASALKELITQKKKQAEDEMAKQSPGWWQNVMAALPIPALMPFTRGVVADALNSDQTAARQGAEAEMFKLQSGLTELDAYAKALKPAHSPDVVAPTTPANANPASFQAR